MIKRTTIFIFLSILFISMPTKVFSYGNDAHGYIAYQSLILFGVNNPASVEELSQDDLDNIYEYSIMADYQNYTNLICILPPTLPGTWVWCNEPEVASRDHFWNPDTNEGEPLPCKTAHEKAYMYWDKAIEKYSAGEKSEAYKFLGAIAHLLTDMASVAHVHLDQHLDKILPDAFQGCISGVDSYENYYEKASNYTSWGAKDAAKLNPIPEEQRYLHGLFYSLAQITQYFPSDDVDGNTPNSNEVYWEDFSDSSKWPQGTEGWNDPFVWIRCVDINNYLTVDVADHYIEETNLRKMGEHLIPRAIQYVAALYSIFWHEFHVDIDGPLVTDVLSSNTFTGVGKINGQDVTSWEWDFNNDGTTDATDKSVTYSFKQSGTKTITLKATAPGQTPVQITQNITVKPLPINLEYPDGYEALHVKFSTDDKSCSSQASPCITKYSWNFGDGKPVEEGSSKTSADHTYEDSGSYNAILTLTLDDNSTITSSKYIWVGPGTRYIPGHTIYGDETWYSGGTYELLGSISIAQGGTLTIEPGVTVKLNGAGQIWVSGTLNATGVTFTWADGQTQWGSLSFNGTGANSSKLENCIFEHASGFYNGMTYGIIFILNGASPTITGCTIRNSTAACGIWVGSGSPAISNCTISGTTTYGGIYVQSTASPTVTGCTLTGNQYGIQVIYSANNPVFSGNTYSNNSDGDLYASGTITGSVAWSETGDMAFRISQLTIAAGGSLTIASKTIKLNGAGQIWVSGTLNATGVTFTWADGQTQWGSLSFNGTGANSSKLENCIFEHASGFYNGMTYGIIFILNGASPTITGCTIRNSTAACGIWVGSGSPAISNCTISGTTTYGGIYVQSTASPTVTGCTLTGNQYGIQVIYSANNPVFSGNTYSNNSDGDLYASGTITGSVAWSETGDMAFRISQLTIAAGGSLTIASKTIKLNGAGQIWVSGTLNATGVTFTWADGQTQWGSLSFNGTGANSSKLENCIFEHASGFYNGMTYGIIFILNGASPTITGCTIRNSTAACGIWVGSGSPAISNCTISGTTTYGGIYVQSTASPTVTGCTLTGNQYGIQVIYSANNPVFSGNTYSNNSDGDLYASGTITGSVAWSETGDMAFRISQLTIAAGGSLTIASKTIKLNGAGQIWVSGTLNATGVTFTWADGQTQWGSLSFNGTGANSSKLENCIFEHASGFYNGMTYGIIFILNGASPTITGCTIRNSTAACGIWVSGGSPAISNCTISGTTTSGGIYVDSTASPTVTGCTLTGNQYGIQVIYSANNPAFSGNTYSNNTDGDLYASGTITGSVAWSETGDMAFRISQLTIAAGGTLTIESGVTVKLNGAGQILVSGTLNATGVTFTWADGQNQWGSLSFNGTGANSSKLENCIFEHASGYYYIGMTRGIIFILNGASPTITGCTIRNSTAACGIWVSGGSPAISNCTISGTTTSGGIYVDSTASPTVTGCTLTENQYGVYSSGGGTYRNNTIARNTLYGFYYTGSTAIDATNCYWGDPSGPYDPSDDRASGGLYNPDGKGDKVSDKVNYYPWALAPGDADGDGVPDSEDNCPYKPNGQNLGTCMSGSDKAGATCNSDADCVIGCSTNGKCSLNQEDADNDGVGDVCDNCPTACNTEQKDADNDGLGDVCDTDPGCGGCSGIECEQQC